MAESHDLTQQIKRKQPEMFEVSGCFEILYFNDRGLSRFLDFKLFAAVAVETTWWPRPSYKILKCTF